MNKPIKILVTGDRALFSRPELRGERYSYAVPTMSALQGILKSVHWKPEMKYCIHKMYVLNQPQFESITTNAQTPKMQMNAIINSRLNSVDRRSTYTPRTMHILTNVRYVVEFTIELTGKGEHENNCVEKHEAIFLERMKKGQCYRTPCLGAKEFPCDLEVIHNIPDSENRGVQPLGNMLYDIDYSGSKPRPIYKRLVMRDGVVDFSETTNLAGNWVFDDLLKFYEQNKELYQFPKLGYSREKIHFEAVLNTKGKMVSFAPLKLSEKGKILAENMSVPEGVLGRTSGIKPNFLWDNEKYIFAMDKKTVAGEEKQKAFLKKLKEVNQDIPEINTVIKFFESHSAQEEWYSMVEPYISPTGVGNITFRIEGEEELIINHPSVQSAWEEYYKAHIAGSTGVCLVSGKKDVLADMHPLIKGVTNASAFAKLISVGTEMQSFECYGMQGLENSPFSKQTVYEYSTALNWLLSNFDHNIRIGKYSFVIWSDHNKKESLAGLRHLLTGYQQEKETFFEKEEQFHILVMTANASRLVIESYDTFTYGKSEKDLRKFFISHMKAYEKGQTVSEGPYIDWIFLEQWEDSNMTNGDTRGYLLGNLLAVLEKAQKDAVPSTKTAKNNVVSANINKISMTPAKLFPSLLAKSVHHIDKKDYGCGRRIENILEQLHTFEIPFPERLDSQERSQFMMGYYNGRKELYKFVKKKDIENEDTENNTKTMEEA